MGPGPTCTLSLKLPTPPTSPTTGSRSYKKYCCLVVRPRTRFSPATLVIVRRFQCYFEDRPQNRDRMRRDEALDILSDLDGDEHRWVDFKEDYYIGGIPQKRVEFVKDISSISNSLSVDQQGYLFIGVDDSGNIVGTGNDSREQLKDRPRHIFSYDESDIQEIVDSSLEPAPSFSFHTYTDNGVEFGTLIVHSVQQSPSVIAQDVNDSSGNRLLQQGLVFVRRGSGKKIATHEDIEKIIQRRINDERQDILDNVSRVISLGPDAVEQLGTHAATKGLAVVPSDDAGIEVQERLTRDPASTLDEELNGDIANWVGRGQLSGNKSIWKYYTNAEELTMDGEAVTFLWPSSIKNSVTGLFWLQHVDKLDIVDILLDVPNTLHDVERAAGVLVLAGDRAGFERLLESKSPSADYGTLKSYVDLINEPLDQRINQIIGSYTHDREWNDWSCNFDIRDLDEDQIVTEIEDISEVLSHIYRIDDNRSLLWRANEFKNILTDLEVGLARFLFTTEQTTS